MEPDTGEGWRRGETPSPFTWRIARAADIPVLHQVMNRAIASLQTGFLDPEQIAASRKVMGLDSQLIADGTYFIVEQDGNAAGCGGWSFRATLYGGDDSVVGREPARLDPAHSAAKVRAMYTHPDFVRQGVGKLILSLCEGAARNAGFDKVELMATAAGVPLYRAAGYAPIAEVEHAKLDGVAIPLLLMGKRLV